jgi:hypothetical protein
LTNSMAKGMYIFNGRTIGGCSAHWWLWRNWCASQDAVANLD